MRERVLQFFFTMSFLRYTGARLCLILLLGGIVALFPDLAKSGERTSQHKRHLLVLAEDGTVVCRRVFPEAAVFGIRFIHSVAKSPVIDWFSAPEGVLQLDKTVYQDFGAGLPHAPGPGQTMEQRDGHVIIDGFAMRLPYFDVRVGRVAQHTLLLPEIWEAIPLNSLAPPGTALRFTVE